MQIYSLVLYIEHNNGWLVVICIWLQQAASLEVRAESEEQQTSGLQAVLKSMEVPSELAGDPAALKQPGGADTGQDCYGVAHWIGLELLCLFLRIQYSFIVLGLYVQFVSETSESGSFTSLRSHRYRPTTMKVS